MAGRAKSRSTKVELPKGSSSVTLDTGALIALDKKDPAMLRFVAVWKKDKTRVVVPAAVLVEWWHGKNQAAWHWEIEEKLPTPLAKRAGEARAQVATASAVDAIVVASASQRGDTVFTADEKDLSALLHQFPTVKLWRV
jgi:predicted nucleic acid-binding protein